MNEMKIIKNEFTTGFRLSSIKENKTIEDDTDLYKV